MKILLIATFFILHAATCLAVLNKVSASNPNEGTAPEEAEKNNYRTVYQYSGSQQQYVSPPTQPGYQYVISNINQPTQVPAAGPPVYQHSSAAQVLASDVSSSLPNKRLAKTESNNYLVTQEQRKATTAQVKQPQEIVNPGYAPPEYHSSNYYLPRQPPAVQQQAPQKRSPQFPVQEQEYFVARPDQRVQEVFNNQPTINLISSLRVPLSSIANGYEDCAYSNVRNENEFPPNAVSAPALNAYQYASPAHQSVASHVQQDPGSPQAISHATASSSSSKQVAYLYNQKPQIVEFLPSPNAYESGRPPYPSANSAYMHTAGYHSQVDGESGQYSYNYRYQQPSLNPPTQIDPNNFKVQVQQIIHSPTPAYDIPQSAGVAPHYLPHLQTNVPAVSTPKQPRPIQTPNSIDVPSYAQNHKGLGHYNYVQSSPTAVTSKDEHLAGEQQVQQQYQHPLQPTLVGFTSRLYPQSQLRPRTSTSTTDPESSQEINQSQRHSGSELLQQQQQQPLQQQHQHQQQHQQYQHYQQQQQVEYAKPSGQGQDYLQMQSQSFELPTYASLHTTLPVFSGYAKQRTQGNQPPVQYSAQFNTNQQPSGLIAATYLPPSNEVQPPYI